VAALLALPLAVAQPPRGAGRRSRGGGGGGMPLQPLDTVLAMVLDGDKDGRVTMPEVTQTMGMLQVMRNNFSGVGDMKRDMCPIVR